MLQIRCVHTRGKAFSMSKKIEYRLEWLASASYLVCFLQKLVEQWENLRIQYPQVSRWSINFERSWDWTDTPGYESYIKDSGLMDPWWCLNSTRLWRIGAWSTYYITLNLMMWIGEKERGERRRDFWPGFHHFQQISPIWEIDFILGSVLLEITWRWEAAAYIWVSRPTEPSMKCFLYVRMYYIRVRLFEIRCRKYFWSDWMKLGNMDNITEE